MNLYGITTCDTCRKALKALGDVEFVDLKKHIVPTEVIAAAFEQVGEALVNKRGTTWRGLSDEDKAREAIDLVEAYPMVMKRPLIEEDGRFTVGWPRD